MHVKLEGIPPTTFEDDDAEVTVTGATTFTYVNDRAFSAGAFIAENFEDCFSYLLRGL